MDTPTTRVVAPPGGASSFSLGWDSHNRNTRSANDGYTSRDASTSRQQNGYRQGMAQFQGKESTLKIFREWHRVITHHDRIMLRGPVVECREAHQPADSKRISTLKIFRECHGVITHHNRITLRGPAVECLLACREAHQPADSKRVLTPETCMKRCQATLNSLRGPLVIVHANPPTTLLVVPTKILATSSVTSQQLAWLLLQEVVHHST